jgi:hypothetical protein
MKCGYGMGNLGCPLLRLRALHPPLIRPETYLGRLPWSSWSEVLGDSSLVPRAYAQYVIGVRIEERAYLGRCVGLEAFPGLPPDFCARNFFAESVLPGWSITARVQSRRRLRSGWAPRQHVQRWRTR